MSAAFIGTHGHGGSPRGHLTMRILHEQSARYRPVYIVGMPVLLMVCIVATTVTLLVTSEPLAGLPLLAVSLTLLAHMRCIIIWLSTPAERRILRATPMREAVTRRARSRTTGESRTAGETRGSSAPMQEGSTESIRREG